MLLKDCVRNFISELCDWIAWVAFWRKGKSWFSEAFYPDDSDYDSMRMVLDAGDFQRLHEIMEQDEDAIFLNGYYNSLGIYEDGAYRSLDAVCDFVELQYFDYRPLISDWALEQL